MLTFDARELFASPFNLFRCSLLPSVREREDEKEDFLNVMTPGECPAGSDGSGVPQVAQNCLPFHQLPGCSCRNVNCFLIFQGSTMWWSWICFNFQGSRDSQGCHICFWLRNSYLFLSNLTLLFSFMSFWLTSVFPRLVYSMTRHSR